MIFAARYNSEKLLAPEHSGYHRNGFAKNKSNGESKRQRSVGCFTVRSYINSNEIAENNYTGGCLSSEYGESRRGKLIFQI